MKREDKMGRVRGLTRLNCQSRVTPAHTQDPPHTNRSCRTITRKIITRQDEELGEEREAVGAEEDFSLWTFSWTRPTGRRLRTDPEHTGGIRYSIWTGNASGSLRRKWETSGENEDWDALFSLLLTRPRVTPPVGRC